MGNCKSVTGGRKEEGGEGERTRTEADEDLYEKSGGGEVRASTQRSTAQHSAGRKCAG